MNNHEVILNFLDDRPEFRFPKLPQNDAWKVAELYKKAYPGALVEVAYRGMRSVR